MIMKALIIGAGKTGEAAAHRFTKFADVKNILVVDRDISLAEKVREKWGWKIEAGQIDVNDFNSVKKIMEGQDVALSCVPYHHNLSLLEAAITERVHFVDLGGNNDIVQSQLKLHQQAAAK